MKYFSLNKKAPQVNFKEAVIKGLAPDKGLYFPETIHPLSNEFFDAIQNHTNQEIAFKVIEQFIGDEIPIANLKKIIEETLNFEFPLIKIEDNLYCLELFHGPTLAFKDVGARFMARCLSHFNKNNQNKVTVLVATSGDTGGAVANGFLNAKGVNVVILYPSGKVSEIQEKQLTTLNNNITALEVNGNFDDCQAMVKKAFLDKELTQKLQLTSANSINIARWLPQMFYYFIAYKQLKSTHKNIVFSVPSGNFGNICAGMMAQKLGLPIHKFIASTNSNHVVSNYLTNGKYEPLPTKHTISNAMDVGNPSNFIRIQHIYNDDFATLKNSLISYYFSDRENKIAMSELYSKYNYIADPHGAIGYLGLKKYLDNNTNTVGIFLETAHPVKFLPIVKTITQHDLPLPIQVSDLINKEKHSININNYTQLKSFLLKSTN